MNEMAEIIKEGIKQGIFNGQALAFSTAAVAMVIQSQKKEKNKKNNNIAEACKSLQLCKHNHECLRADCPDETSK